MIFDVACMSNLNALLLLCVQFTDCSWNGYQRGGSGEVDKLHLSLCANESESISIWDQSQSISGRKLIYLKNSSLIFGSIIPSQSEGKYFLLLLHLKKVRFLEEKQRTLICNTKEN